MDSKEERIRLLSLVDIFEPLSREEIERLNGQLPDLHLEGDEIVYDPEDRSERLFILKKGKVRIFKTAPDGREFTLAVVDAGTVFGEMALTAQRLEGAYAGGVLSLEKEWPKGAGIATGLAGAGRGTRSHRHRQRNTW